MKKQFMSLFVVLVTAGFVLAAGAPSWAAKTYTMKQGDTLWDLSAKFFGDPTLYPAFLEVNDISNPRTIPVGREIIVPSYDEMKKIAQEPDPDKRKAMIKNVTGGTTTASSNSNSSSSSTSDPANPPRSSDSGGGPINPKDVSIRKILEGPGVSGDKLKSVETASEGQ